MRLDQQIAFLKEMDKLKRVIRQTHLVDGSRKENTAEHSWHIMIAAVTLAEYADEALDLLQVMKLLLVHDIVEIDAGDTFAFDEVNYEDKPEREQRAAERLFGLLPDDQREAFIALWHEFEAMNTNEARFANAIDRLMPFLHNMWTDGAASWKAHQPRFEQVYQRNVGGVGSSSAVLWDYAQSLLQRAVDDGWLSPPEN
ncbi:MAG: HD domain-containing protein [Anaerolineae bacterium]